MVLHQGIGIALSQRRPSGSPSPGRNTKVLLSLVPLVVGNKKNIGKARCNKLFTPAFHGRVLMLEQSRRKIPAPFTGTRVEVSMDLHPMLIDASHLLPPEELVRHLHALSACFQLFPFPSFFAQFYGQALLQIIGADNSWRFRSRVDAL